MSRASTRHYRRSLHERLKSYAPWRGRAHYVFTAGFALAIAFLALAHLSDVHGWEWSVIPFGILYGNLVEYVVHRFPLHRKIRGFRLAYDRHAIQHHRYFTNDRMAALSPRQFRIVLFPEAAIVAFIPVAAGPIAYGIGATFGANAGCLTLATGVLYFALYESVHLTNHLPRSHWVFKIPGIAFMCRFHRLHHDPRHATKWNFNVTFPLFDWVFGTLKVP